MSTKTKRCYRFFTLTDYEKEEKWLRDMAKKGWMLKSCLIPIVYNFEKIEPQDIVFKLDFQNTKTNLDYDYMRMLDDYGWTYLTSFNNYRYLYKTASNNESDNEIYTDNTSKLEMLRRIFRFRVLPIMGVFLCCVIPNFVRAIEEGFTSDTLNAFWGIIMILYVVVFLKIGVGYNRLFKKYTKQ